MADVKMNIYEKLSHIQNEMCVPKNLYNSHGNYYYRNAETILESAKPICRKYRTTLVVEDGIEYLEGRFYVKAIATLMDWDSIEQIENCAFAREVEERKGMDGSQLTGACSSYARKYALNGLFNLDDVKDADAKELAQELNNKNGKPKAEVNTYKITQNQIKVIMQAYKGDNLTKLLKSNNLQKLEDMPKAKATEIIKKINEIIKQKEENAKHEINK